MVNKKIKISKKENVKTENIQGTELEKCKLSIKFLIFAIIMYLFSIVLDIIAIQYCSPNNILTISNNPSTINSLSPADQSNCSLAYNIGIASNIIKLISIPIVVICSVNAAFYGCFKTAILGTQFYLFLM